MFRILSTVTISLCLAFTSFGQQTGPSAAETKLRELLKAANARVTSAETEAAGLKAEKATSETKIKDLEKSVAEMIKRIESLDSDLKQSKEAAAQKESDLKKELEGKETELSKHKKALDSWQAAHVEISKVAKKKEADRKEAEAKGAALERRIADLRARNAEMYKVGNEVLDRFKGFSLGQAISAREPFIGRTRAKLETIVQELSDQLLDATADSKRVPKSVLKEAATPEADSKGKPATGSDLGAATAAGTEPPTKE